MKSARLALRRARRARRRGRRLERAQARRADRDDAPAARARRRDRGCGLRRDRGSARVHRVLREIVGAHRLERAGADVQRDVRDGDAGRRERGQAAARRSAGRPSARRPRRGGARRRSGSARRPPRSRGARDVRRQRHLAVALEIIEERGDAVEVAARRSGRCAPRRVALHAAGEQQHAARLAADGSRAAGRAPSCGPSTRSSSSSTLPPVGLAPRSRALITRVSLNTSRSPGATSARQIGECEVVERACRRRAAGGCPCAPAPVPARSARGGSA